MKLLLQCPIAHYVVVATVCVGVSCVSSSDSSSRSHGRLCDTLDPGAVSVVVPLDAYATLFEDEGNVSSSSSSSFVVGHTEVGIRRALLRFDVTSLPSDARVECANIGLDVEHDHSSPGDDHDHTVPRIALYRSTSPWTTTTTTTSSNNNNNTTISGNSSTTTTLQGSAAVEGDVTWTHASWPTVEWSTAGGDFDPDGASSEEEVAAYFRQHNHIDGHERHWIGSTRTVRDTLQRHVDDASNNDGFILVPRHVPPQQQQQQQQQGDGDDTLSTTDATGSSYNVYHNAAMVIRFTSLSMGYPVRNQEYWQHKALRRYNVTDAPTPPSDEQHAFTATNVTAHDDDDGGKTSSFAGGFATGFATALALVGATYYASLVVTRRRVENSAVPDLIFVDNDGPPPRTRIPSLVLFADVGVVDVDSDLGDRTVS